MGTIGYLLDTHTLLWVLRGKEKLGACALKAILDQKSQKFVSAVSAYEIIYKHKIGKLSEFDDVAKNYFEYLKTLEAIPLPIYDYHAHLAGMFDWQHRDPFDRLLAAQASLENLTIITNDSAFETLSWVKVLW